MNIIVILLLLFFLVKLWTDFDKYVIIAAAWILPLQMLVIGSFTLMNVIAIIVIAVSIIKRRDSVGNFPFWVPTVLLIASITLSNMFGHYRHWGSCLQMITLNALFPYYFWSVTNSRPKIMLFIKHSFIFLCLLVIYGLFEEITRENPLIEFMMTNDAFVKSIYNTSEIRFGMKRLQSFLPLCGALGCCCTMNFLLFGYLQKNKSIISFSYQKYVPYLLAGMFLCLLFTGSRSVIAGFFVMLLYFMNVKSFKSPKFLLAMPFIFFALFLSVGFFAKILESFTNTESVGGSNSGMREMQFVLALYFMMRAPFLGNGLAYTFEYVQASYPDEILGAESVWLPLMIDQGILGVVAYLLYLIVPLWYGVSKKNYVVALCVLSFAIEKSLSSLPGIHITYFMIYVIMFMKISDIYGIGIKRIRRA